MKLTKAQKRFLTEHLNGRCWTRRDRYEDGFRPKYLADRGSPTYDFVGRVRDLGFIEIAPSAHSDWPYSWEGTRLTDAGRRALEAEADYQPMPDGPTRTVWVGTITPAKKEKR